MIQIIGMMVGPYIIVRMASMWSREGERKESSGTRILALLCFLWTLLMMLAILLIGG